MKYSEIKLEVSVEITGSFDKKWEEGFLTYRLLERLKRLKMLNFIYFSVNSIYD